MRRSAWLYHGCLAAMAAGMASPALSQTVTPPDSPGATVQPVPQSGAAAVATPDQNASASPGSPTQVDTVVVTARRVSENIQSTPVSITAFTNTMLQQADITKTADLMLQTPGVFLSGSGGRENSVFQIRGQSKALSGFNSPAVVSYFADVPQPTFGSSVDLYDMASVQVLKGPQGTLFGRNTTGGAVLYYPATPGYDHAGYVEAGWGRFNDRQFEGAVDLPLVEDKAALRIAAQYDKRDGYTDNIGVGGKLDGDDHRAFRASLRLDPVSYVKNVTIFDYYDNFYAGDSVNIVGLDNNPSLLDELGLRQAAAQELALQQGRGPFVVNSDTNPAKEQVRKYGVTNRTDVKLPDGLTFTNIFGYRRTFVAYNINTDGVPALASTGNPEIGIPPGLPLTLLNAGANTHTEQFTDEVQLKGKALGGKADFLLGFFELHSQPYGTTGTGDSIGQFGGSPTATFDYNFYTENSQAVFANVNFDLGQFLHGLRFDAGIRYTWDHESACTATDNVTTGTIGPDGCAAGVAPLINATTNTAKSSAPTATVGFDWQISPNIFTYVASRRGYRSGGINSPTLGGTLASLQSFGPEYVTDVEVGARTDFELYGVRFRLNASGFVGFYDNVQIVLSGLLTQPGCKVGDPAFGKPPFSPDGDCNPNNDPQSGTLLVNAGQSRISGLDFDGFVKPIDHFTITFGGNVLDPQTESFNAPSQVASYVASSKIPFNLTARATFSAGAHYDIPVPRNGDIVLSAEAYHSSRLAFTDTSLPSYNLVNFSADWNGIAGRPVDLDLYMSNAFDAYYQATGAVSGLALGFNSAIYGPPRQYGFRVRYHFGG